MVCPYSMDNVSATLLDQLRGAAALHDDMALANVVFMPLSKWLLFVELVSSESRMLRPPYSVLGAVRYSIHGYCVYGVNCHS